MGRRARVAIAIAAATVLAAAAPAAASVRLYVSLGDSYTAGPLIPAPTGDPIDCGRSTHNYPSLVAGAIRPGRFVDVSCGSATTKDMTSPQTGLPLGGTNPPQFNALGPRVDLVTVGIGGNDMGFGGIVGNCVRLAFRTFGSGHPCTDLYTVAGVDTIARRIDDVVAPRLLRVIRGIQTRSPRARVVVVGDPDPVPPQPGCFPIVPIAAGDLPYLHRVAHNLAAMKKRIAAIGGTEFVDLVPGSAGHDICKLPGTKWYEGIVPTSPAYPAHPNTLGMEYAAREVLKVLRRPIPNAFSIVSRRGGRTGAVALRLRAPYRGTFTVAAGRGRLRYATRTAFAPRAGDVRVRLGLGRHGRALLRRRGRVRVRLRITFAPVAGEPATRRSSVRVG